MRNFFLGAGAAVSGLAFLVACGGDETTCGDGTRKAGSECVPDTEGAAGAVGSPGGAGAGQGGGDAGGGDAGSLVPDFAGATAAAPASANSILVTWEAVSDAVTPASAMRYRIYVGTAAGAFNDASFLEVPAGATSFLVTALAPDTEYFFRVRAVNGLGNEDENGVEVAATTGKDGTAPEFAGATAATTVEGGKVALSWAAGSDEQTPTAALRYVVYAGLAAGEQRAVPVGISDPGATSVTVTLSQPDTEYFFIVRAVDAAGNESTLDPAQELSGTSGADVDGPTFGGCGSVTIASGGTIKVTWDPAIDDISSQEDLTYRVYLAEEPTDGSAPTFQIREEIFTNVTEGLIAGGLSPATNYLVRCNAVDGANLKDDNERLFLVTTPDDAVAPVFDGIVDVTDVDTTTVVVNWAEASDNKTDPSDIIYRVFGYEVGQEKDQMVELGFTTGQTSLQLTELKSNQGYNLLVFAEDGVGNRDDNVAEQEIRTLVSWSIDIQGGFMLDKCALSGCHVQGGGGTMALTEDEGYARLVNAASTFTATGETEPMLRVKPNDPDNSFLYRKLVNNQVELPYTGDVMPPPSESDFLTEEQKTAVRLWIEQGALEN